jgi:isopentenyl-diphosphate delta-isomerase
MTDELIDLLDSNGKPTGNKVMKSEAHAKGLWHNAVHVWLFNSKGEALLQKRALDKDSFPGLWDISSAGHVSAGETPEHAAVRELEEELGIKAKPEDLKKITVRRSEIEPKPGFHNKEYDHIYLLKFDGDVNALKIQKEELDEVKFIPLDKLEADIKDAKKFKAYVPNKPYFFYIIEVIRKELKAKN